MNIPRKGNRALLMGLAFVACLSVPAESTYAVGRGGGGHVQRGGGGMAHGPHGGQLNNSRADARTRNVRNTSVNNVNRNTNINRNVNVNVDHRGGWDDDYHPVATAAAVTAAVGVTSAIVGSIVNSVPPNCAPVNYGGMIYQRCGSTWYQPQGSQYIVVNAPY
ncbi:MULTISPECIES: hypothetical protein [unclassified Caballeronia]|uniref:hypothetical protein n=1 Tax=unclassified Caballeronia TaxID=2646786 RepID=UPI001F2522B6|nr:MULTISPECIES: hypothetical protein [unclassified Caballeronia]MCE4546046.1 hypothetical protein [Caballeronia sp. PC1]MCE4573481.1 hypothetical protein [Caballeronia sp. CLC5]